MYNAVGELQTHVIDGKHFTEHSLFPKTMVLNGAPRRFQGAVESFLHRGLVYHHCTGGGGGAWTMKFAVALLARPESDSIRYWFDPKPALDRWGKLASKT